MKKAKYLHKTYKEIYQPHPNGMGVLYYTITMCHRIVNVNIACDNINEISCPHCIKRMNNV